MLTIDYTDFVFAIDCVVCTTVVATDCVVCTTVFPIVLCVQLWLKLIAMWHMYNRGLQ